jgi:hypothetical protein
MTASARRPPRHGVGFGGVRRGTSGRGLAPGSTWPAIGFLRLLPLAAVALAASIAPGGDAESAGDGEANAASRRKLVLIAGKPSHPPLQHEFRAGTLLLARRLEHVPGLVVERHDGGWVADEAALEDAAAVVIYSDGGGGHPAIQLERLERLRRLVARGMGFGCMHYAVEVPPDRGGPDFLAWLGGFYESGWSCNPLWTASFTDLPDHPITRGVRPFATRDEWYFNIRFRAGFTADDAARASGTGFAPLLVAVPDDAVRDGPYVHPKGPYPHVQAARGRKEALLWAVERPDGGRGFGFTGGHFHRGWQNDDLRRTVLNALCWVAGLDVPPGGIESPPVSETEIMENLDPKK